MADPCLENPPRKYSVNQRDFDFEVGRRLRVFVDGVEQENVVEFDCDEGTLLKYKLGSDGKPLLDEKRRDLSLEVVRGVVTVEWADG